MAEAQRSQRMPRGESESGRQNHTTSQTVSNVAIGLDPKAQAVELPLGSGFGDATFQNHVELLSDIRMSHSANAPRRASIVQQLQRSYGNQYVQRVVNQVMQVRASRTYSSQNEQKRSRTPRPRDSDNAITEVEPLGMHSAVQRFEAGEHAQFGGKKGKQRSIEINGVKMTYGEAIAMGDLFATPQDMQKADPKELQAILVLIRKDTIKPGSVTTEEWQKATGGRYMDLAAKNEAHFAPSNPKLTKASAGKSGDNHKTEWEKYHAQAIAKAQEGKKDEALAINAFADHFLTDAFSSGHLINKLDVMETFKKQLATVGKTFFDSVAKTVWADQSTAKFVSQYETVKFEGYIFRPNINSVSRFSKLLQGINDEEPDALSSIVSKVIHDKLNTEGVEVQNARGDKWKLYGDASLDTDTLKVGREAVAASQQNVMRIAGTGSDVIDMAQIFKLVWDYVPASTPGGTKYIQEQIKKLTDPTQKATIDEVAKILITNIQALIDELVARKILKKA